MLIVFAANPTSVQVSPATNIIYQSKDGGQTWEDVSYTLPETIQPEDFFVGESDLYLRVNNSLYHSKSNLKTPVWEKENVPNSGSNAIAFNRSGEVSLTYQGQVYQRKSSSANWAPVYTNFKKQTLRTVFETTDGTVFLGSDNGLYKQPTRDKAGS